MKRTTIYRWATAGALAVAAAIGFTMWTPGSEAVADVHAPGQLQAFYVLDQAPGILDGLDPAPTYPILIDIGRTASPAIERTTVYLVDERGHVAQVFPMMTHMRATARTLLREIDRLR